MGQLVDGLHDYRLDLAIALASVYKTEVRDFYKHLYHPRKLKQGDFVLPVAALKVQG
jgi:hypothetical protein